MDGLIKCDRADCILLVIILKTRHKGKEKMAVRVKRVVQGQPTELTDIVYIDAGFEYCLAIDKDGRIRVRGRKEQWGCGGGMSEVRGEFCKKAGFDA